MPKSTSFITSWLNHVFTNAAIANIGDVTGLPAAGTVGSLYLSLHTADPGKAGTQSTNEATYTGYARIAVVRSSSGWTVSGSQVTNAAVASFAQCTGGSNVITHIGVGAQSSGANQLLYYSPYSLSQQGIGTAVAATDIITIPGHTLSVNDNVQFYQAFGATMPTGITSGTNYFVKTVSGNDITISTTNGGATLDITAAGSCDVYKTSTLTVSNNITPSFAIGGITIIED